MPASVENQDAVDLHLLQGMLDTMGDHVFILRAEGARYRLVYCNRAMDAFMNHSDVLLCGRYLDEIVPDPVLCKKISDNYTRAIENGKRPTAR